MEIFVLAFFAIGYLILAGADIGIGMLLPYLGRTSDQRREVIAAIAPFFLGNEVWLVATGGILAGLFPTLEGELLSGNYGVIVALLASWVLRDMGLWLRGRVLAGGWQALWDGVIVAGSWGLALSLGTLLSDILLGVSGPVGMLPALIMAVLFAAHGLAFASLRLRGELRARATVLSAQTGEGVTYALTSGVIAALAIVAGLRLPLTDSHTGVAAFLAPVVLVLIPFLVAAQAWVWWTFRHRVTGPSYL
ncbi:cytochrome d ubiquinol oxidase subunit II [Nonomuraea sp. NPDC050556]|uniref:cytochrome d ubiquinol oxidase subunit II n=1 Tax=Nonomuraea sp. NPDC050556 TaxID=3364369 RepID=UPI0037B2CD13